MRVWLLVASATAVLTGCDCGPSTGCPNSGTGSVAVTVTGLPSGAAPKVTVTGPAGTQTVDTAMKTLSGLAGGYYTVTADNVVTPDPRVRTVWKATLTPGQVCVKDGASAPVTVDYAALPTSNRLWVNNGTGGSGSPLGFSSTSLAATGAPPADVAPDTGTGRDLAFDKDGNVWAFGSTDATVQRFKASVFSTGGAKTPDLTVTLPISCVPPTTGMAFDPAGNLWVSSTCEKKVYEVTAAQLSAGGAVTPSATLPLNNSASGVAFDKNGNLWASDPDDTKLLRFDFSGGAPSSTSPSFALSMTGMPIANALHPYWLAFDATGNLWVNDFGANVIFKLTPTDLSGTGSGSVTPTVQITLQAGALLEGMAFDEGGGLWVAYSAGKFARLDPSQLTTSTNAGNPTIPSTVISSGDVGYAANLAFFPAPAATPLYSALP